MRVQPPIPGSNLTSTPGPRGPVFCTPGKPNVSSVHMAPSTLEMSIKEGTTEQEESVSQAEIDILEREAIKARKEYEGKKVCFLSSIINSMYWYIVLWWNLKCRYLSRWVLCMNKYFCALLNKQIILGKNGTTS